MYFFQWSAVKQDYSDVQIGIEWRSGRVRGSGSTGGQWTWGKKGKLRLEVTGGVCYKILRLEWAKVVYYFSIIQLFIERVSSRVAPGTATGWGGRMTSVFVSRLLSLMSTRPWDKITIRNILSVLVYTIRTQVMLNPGWVTNFLVQFYSTTKNIKDINTA